MIKESFAALGASTRDLFRNWRGLLLLAIVYGLLLAGVYYFFATGVANVWQLFVTAATAAAAPLLFFLFQAAAANAALPEATAAGVARRAPRDLLKVLLLAVPVAVVAVLFVYLLGKLQGWLPTVGGPSLNTTVAGVMGERPAPLHWQEALLSSSWLVLLGVVLPLTAAHLWLSAVRVGLTATLKGFHRVVGRAFVPRSVLVYAVGLFLFGLMPYFVLFTRTAVTNGWAEVTLFGLRLALAFTLTLMGWLVTLGALARVTPPETGTPAAVEPAPAEPAPESVTEPQLQA
ncbi:MAG: hypothetical protein QOH49_4432 [Acidobacteriota bacterium]|jgi:branched-subunit amino acid transport protein AzlD|nr:hypothetical protein [Acidobacteriota bacterium]